MANPDLIAKIQAAQPHPHGLDTPTAIQRYLAGESMQVLAREAGITRQSLYLRIQSYCLSHEGPDYADLITQALVQRVAEADAALEAATDAVATSRARERCRFARMDLERRRPKLYGQKQEIQTDNTIRVIIDDRSPLPVTPYIDVAPSVITSTPEVIDNTSDGEGE